MSWFFFALICILGWGFADLFYKKGTDETDKMSHLKIAVWVGITMGVVSLVLIPFSESQMDFVSLFVNAGKYSPASLAYILSMVIGYAGLRYIELSIISPVQNSSGALSMIAMVVFFAIAGQGDTLAETFGVLDIIGTSIIIVGVIALAVVEQRISKEEIKPELAAETKKYRFGALALLFPILYCVFDTIGTAADGIILDEEVGLGLGEIDVLILYGLTFLVAGLGCWIFMLIKNKKPYNPFNLKKEWPKATASVCEEFGQIFYVYAMAANPVLAAPLVSAYCIVSVLLSRIIIKEKLKLSQYICIAAVIAGIILLGISEGLAEI
ncbi:MAG: EamA family transporter [Clostridia bacterium]|nr:EamA family transporter [Clostridia bacterium]MBP5592565.1 EamA family transporter [Clostridia bacterium]